MQVLILAGGKGTRLWPLSRKYYPKPFIKLHQLGGKSLFQKTVERALAITDSENTWIVVADRHDTIVRNQLEEMGVEVPEDHILIEPTQRDTLPAVLYALFRMPEDVVTLMPSDQYVKEVERLAEAVKLAEKYADRHIVAIGVKPTEPYTGYGYIKPGRKIDENVYEVDEFKEKPDIETAKTYVKKKYLWNTFIHVFSRNLMLKEIEKYAPEVYLTFKKYNCDAERIYPIIEPISLSSQVLEKSKKNAVIPVALTWSDMGSYDLMHKLSDKDENGNVANTNFISLDAHGNFVETYNGKTVAMIGVDDLFVIDTPDALIIGPHSRSQDVKTIFKMLEQRKHPVTDYHTRIEMRWGHVQIVESTEDYTIAKIFLRPGARAKIQIEYPATVSVVKGSVAVASGKDRKILETGNAVSTSNEIIELENLERDPAEIVMTVIANLKTNPYVEILKELEG